ncbi:MAG: hypothetical protein EPN88_13925 [Bacteroidetes bacterium]|nr:MAG: hypothetical protein EPN88_13925 [Bacteroidota bacterium]
MAKIRAIITCDKIFLYIRDKYIGIMIANGFKIRDLGGTKGYHLYNLREGISLWIDNFDIRI